MIVNTLHEALIVLIVFLLLTGLSFGLGFLAYQFKSAFLMGWNLMKDDD